MKKRIIAAVTAVCMMAASMTGCTEAKRATHNVQKEADYFNVERRLSVINARTDKPILELIGYFSLSNNSDNELVITLEVAENQYKVDYVYLNNWTIYTVEDVSGAHVDPYHYEINFLPEMIQPIKFTQND